MIPSVDSPIVLLDTSSDYNAMAKIAWFGLISAILVIVIGILFIVDPDLALDIFGFFLLLWGVVLLIAAFMGGGN